MIDADGVCARVQDPAEKYTDHRIYLSVYLLCSRHKKCFASVLHRTVGKQLRKGPRRAGTRSRRIFEYSIAGVFEYWNNLRILCNNCKTALKYAKNSTNWFRPNQAFYVQLGLK